MYSINKSVKKHMPLLRSARILDQLRERICYRNYSLRTEEAYVYWVKAFIRFHELRHPATPRAIFHYHIRHTCEPA